MSPASWTRRAALGGGAALALSSAAAAGSPRGPGVRAQVVILLNTLERACADPEARLTLVALTERHLPGAVDLYATVRLDWRPGMRQHSVAATGATPEAALADLGQRLRLAFDLAPANTRSLT